LVLITVKTGLPDMEECKNSLDIDIEALDFRKEIFHIQDNALCDRICVPLEWVSALENKDTKQPALLANRFEFGTITSDSFCVHILISYAL